MNVTIGDVMHHIANSCKGYQDGDLYFYPPHVDGDTIRLLVHNESEDEHEEFVFRAVDFE